LFFSTFIVEANTCLLHRQREPQMTTPIPTLSANISFLFSGASTHRTWTQSVPEKRGERKSWTFSWQKRKSCTPTPQIQEKVFFGQIKFGYFVNFSYIYFRAKCLFSKLTELPRLCSDHLRHGRIR